MSHLNDGRRPRCKEALLAGGFPEVPSSLVQLLDDEARVRSKKARREGHSYAIACDRAKRADGRFIGRISAAPPRSD